MPTFFLVCTSERAEKAEEKEERSYGSIMMERLTGSDEGRIDHVLQVGSYPFYFCF